MDVVAEVDREPAPHARTTPAPRPPGLVAVPARLDEQVARKLVEIVGQVRELDLKKPPSIAESIDWARTLLLLGAGDIDHDTFIETMSVIVKHRTDLDTVAARVGVALQQADAA